MNRPPKHECQCSVCVKARNKSPKESPNNLLLKARDAYVAGCDFESAAMFRDLAATLRGEKPHIYRTVRDEPTNVTPPRLVMEPPFSVEELPGCTDKRVGLIGPAIYGKASVEAQSGITKQQLIADFWMPQGVWDERNPSPTDGDLLIRMDAIAAADKRYLLAGKQTPAAWALEWGLRKSQLSHLGKLKIYGEVIADIATVPITDGSLCIIDEIIQEPEVDLMEAVAALEKKETVALTKEDRARVLRVLGRSHGHAAG